MRGKDCQKRRNSRHLLTAATLAALLAGLALNNPPLHAAATGRGTPATASSPAPAASATSPAPAATRPALQADAILGKFPGNANVLAARSDARNFTVEGRVRDVRTVAVDATGGGGATAPAFPDPGMTELRVALVGRSQADDVPAHFACRFDKATEEAAARLQPDQIIRLTGSLGAAVPAADRINLLNCHNLSETGPLNVGDQLVGLWRCNDVMVDGAALRKANQARGIKSDNIPDADYAAPWHLDLILKADGTLAAELADNTGQTLKKLSGRCQVLKDGPAEARLRMDIQGALSQETTATFDAGRLQLTLPGLADKCLLPDTRFGKLEGTIRTVDYKALKDQTMQWFGANLTGSNANNIAKFVSTTVDTNAASHQGFALNIGAGAIRRGKTTLVLGVYGKLLILEYSNAQTQANAVTRMNFSGSPVKSSGTLMAPEVRIEALSVDNRNNFDASKPLTGKITLRALRRMSDAQYLLFASSATGPMKLDKPGPDPQTFDFRFNPLAALPGNPRLILFVVGRQPQPNDLYGDNANHVISDPVPVLLDLAPPR